MALGTLGEFKTRNELALTAAQDDAVAGVLVECEDAIKALCKPTTLSSVTDTDAILDAPHNSPVLFLPLTPVRTLTSVYFNAGANGVAANFTSDHLLVEGTDYDFPRKMRPENWSRDGAVRLLTRSYWGVTLVRRPGCLAFERAPGRGMVKVTYTAGFPSVLPRVTTALYMATAMLLARRKFGAMMTSASLNGASYSLAGPATATAVVHSPDVLASLRGLYDPVLVGGA